MSLNVISHVVLIFALNPTGNLFAVKDKTDSDLKQSEYCTKSTTKSSKFTERLLFSLSPVKHRDDKSVPIKRTKKE